MRPAIWAAVWTLWGSGVLLAEQVAPDVTYQLYIAPGPNRLHVVAFDRLRVEYQLKVGWAEHRRNYGTKQNTSTIAALYDQPPSHDVLAAINGSFIDPINLPNLVGTVASDGEIQEAPQPNPDSEYDTFLFGASRMPLIRSAIRPRPGVLTFANGVTAPLDGYNRPNPPIHTITAYTPTWDSSTRTDFVNPALAVEIILGDVTYPMRSDKEISGIVTAIRTGNHSENNGIPAGGMVLTAWGSALDTVLNNTQLGDRLRLFFTTSEQWYNHADVAISGIGWILHQGAAYTSNWTQRPAPYPGARHPRTVLAWSPGRIFMVVCDGRWPGVSEGMTFQEMADFLTGTLGAIEAVNLDGGGSSTMWVNGTRRNSPEGGSWERPIGNVVLLVRQEDTAPLPFVDSFPPAGRQLGWDDRFSDNDVVAFSPEAPGGDGYVLHVKNPTGGAESVRHGHGRDADYTVFAQVYCEYRPQDASSGFDRCGIFVRDSGTAVFDMLAYGGGNCYLLAHESDTGRIRAGKVVNGTLTDWIAADPPLIASTGWHEFRIDCHGTMIRYWIDGEPIATARDATHPDGFFGIGHHEFFTDNARSHGTRVDRIEARASDRDLIPCDQDFDGDVDQADFGWFQACFSGSGTPQNRRACLGARLDSDDDVDAVDFTLFQGCFSGANITADPACAD